MRILIAVHGFPPTHYAGAERAAERIVKWLVAHQHYVEVFTTENLDAPGLTVQTTHEEGFLVHRVSYNVKENDVFRSLYDYPPLGAALRDVLAQGNFDLVHMISGYLLGGQVIHTVKTFGLPMVVTLTEYWFMCSRLNLLHPNDSLCSGPETNYKCVRCLLEEKRRYRLPAQYAPGIANIFWMNAKQRPFVTVQEEAVALRQTTLRHALEDADLVISPSRFLIDKFAEYGFDTHNYRLIRHGLNMPTVPRKPAPTGILTELRLGYIGQIKAHKGVDLIIDAVLPLLDAGYSINLDLWGTENEAPEYVARLKKMTQHYSNIRWHGRYSGTQVWDILSSFDALIVPSRCYENSPTVILEAYNIGLPVIATNLGGMAELVQHGTNGLLFELNNAADLRKQIIRLLEEPNLLPQITMGVPKVKSADEEVAEIFAHYVQLKTRKFSENL